MSDTLDWRCVCVRVYVCVHTTRDLSKRPIHVKRDLYKWKETYPYVDERYAAFDGGVCVRGCVCMSERARVRGWARVCVGTHKYVCTFVFLYVFKWMFSCGCVDVSVCVRVCMCVFVCIYMNAYKHIYIYIFIHIYIYIYIYIYMYIRLQFSVYFMFTGGCIFFILNCRHLIFRRPLKREGGSRWVRLQWFCPICFNS